MQRLGVLSAGGGVGDGNGLEGLQLEDEEHAFEVVQRQAISGLSSLCAFQGFLLVGDILTPHPNTAHFNNIKSTSHNKSEKSLVVFARSWKSLSPAH